MRGVVRAEEGRERERWNVVGGCYVHCHIYLHNNNNTVSIPDHWNGD